MGREGYVGRNEVCNRKKKVLHDPCPNLSLSHLLTETEKGWGSIRPSFWTSTKKSSDHIKGGGVESSKSVVPD